MEFKPFNFNLEGLRIGRYRVSFDNPGISFVAETEGSPNGVYVRHSEKQGAAVYAVPSRDLNFGWSSGHGNYNLVNEIGSEYGFYGEDRKKKPWFKRLLPRVYTGKMPYPTLPELSSDTLGVLTGMIGTARDYFARNLGIRARGFTNFPRRYVT